MKRCPYCAEEIQDEAIKCKQCGELLGELSGHGPAVSARRLYRSHTDRMMAGVCGGLAQYAGMDPTLMRVLYAVLTLCTGVIPGLILYIVMALIIPVQIERIEPAIQQPT